MVLNCPECGHLMFNECVICGRIISLTQGMCEECVEQGRRIRQNKTINKQITQYMR